MRSEAALRPAGGEDVPACAAILNAWIDATDWMPRVHPADDVARHYREQVFPRQEVTVSERAGEVTGFLALDPQGCVTALYLAPEERGRGVGAELLNLAKARRPKGLTVWTFVTNAPARRFYAWEGFVERRRTAGDNEEGLPDVLFVWPGAA